jgi:hypothetical protein
MPRRRHAGTRKSGVPQSFAGIRTGMRRQDRRNGMGIILAQYR